jgi:hypothetical protein
MEIAQTKKAFHETIKRVNAFKKQIDTSTPFKWVADSALYSKNKLLTSNEYLWLTCVPETIEEAKDLFIRKRPIKRKRRPARRTGRKWK